MLAGSVVARHGDAPSIPRPRINSRGKSRKGEVMLDLSTLDTAKCADEGADLELRHPSTRATFCNDAGDPITIRLVGVDSAIYRKAQAALTNRKLVQNKRGVKITAEELEADALEMAAKCTVSWSSDLALDGAPIPFSKQNAAKLYQRFPWIKEQVEEFINDRANFLQD